jgi:RNA polymerase sigma-70 factor (ECF subfamily)
MTALDAEADPGALVAASTPRLVRVQESGLDLTVGSRAAEAEADRRLVERAREGDEEAFGALVARYGQPVLSLCYASTLDAAEAEDLSQEVFVSAWRNLKRFRGESAFSTWLFALARNACIDRARRLRNRPQLGLPDGLADTRAAGGSPEQATLEAIFVAARALSVPLRQALLLRDLQGLSYEEIAQVQGVPIGTVRSRIAAARSAITQELGG